MPSITAPARLRMAQDPLPAIDPNLPLLRQAVSEIQLELGLVLIEEPGTTQHQALREARRRCYRRMVEVAETLQRRRSPFLAALICLLLTGCWPGSG